MKYFKYTYLIFLILFGCTSLNTDVATIHIKGSDTMLFLTNQLAKEFMNEHPGFSIYVEGGGTAAGIRSLIEGRIDICTASRNLEADEVKQLAEQFGTLGVAYLIGKDGLSIYLNPNNPVKNLTIGQLRDIYTCKITNWKELGGNDEQIIPIIRNPNSGTYLYFKDHILESEEYCSSVRIKATTESIVDEVASIDSAIGYGGVGYVTRVHTSKINGIEPTEENIRNNKYPISRYLYFYSLEPAKGTIKIFIDWVLSPQGQSIVRKSGYIPLFEIPF